MQRSEKLRTPHMDLAEVLRTAETKLFNATTALLRKELGQTEPPEVRRLRASVYFR